MTVGGGNTFNRKKHSVIPWRQVETDTAASMGGLG